MAAIVVTGIGVISSLGNNVQENFSALKSGDTGIGKAMYVNSRYADMMPFAEVRLSTEDLKKNLGLTIILLRAHNCSHCMQLRKQLLTAG